MLRSFHNLRVGVDERLAEPGYDLGQTRSKLLRRTRRHRAHQLHGTLLGPPRVVLETLHQRGQHELDALRRELAHNGARGADRSLSHVLRLIAEAHEEHGEDMDDVGFEQAAESKVEKLESHERALPGIGIFLILHGSLDGVHDAVRLERRYAAPLDRAGETERGAAPICVSLSVGDLRQEALHQRPAFVIRQCLHQRREAVGHGPLHSLGGRGQHGDKPGEDLPDLGIRGVQVARQCPEEDHDALTDVIALFLVLGAAPAPRRLLIKIFFVHREQLLHLFGAVQLDHVTPRGHGRVAHELIVVAEHLG